MPFTIVDIVQIPVYRDDCPLGNGILWMPGKRNFRNGGHSIKTYEKALDPKFGEQVRSSPAYAGHREDLHKRWEEFCTKPIEDLRYRDFKRYYEDGNRRVFEKQFFGRHQLNRCLHLRCGHQPDASVPGGSRSADPPF